MARIELWQQWGLLKTGATATLSNYLSLRSQADTESPPGMNRRGRCAGLRWPLPPQPYSSAVPVCSRGQQPAFSVKKQFPFSGNIGARKQLISLSMTVQGLSKWRGFHQLSILRASFLPAFWLATPSGRLFPPDVGPEPAGAPAAMILKDRNAPTTSRSAAKGNAQGLICLKIHPLSGRSPRRGPLRQNPLCETLFRAMDPRENFAFHWGVEQCLT